MKSKNVVFVEANRAELLEEPIRELKENEVLVRLMVSSISSGTERAKLTGDRSVNYKVAAKAATFPRRCGYSAAGVVEKIGSAVTRVCVGQRVAAIWGKHSQYSIIQEGDVYPIEDISFENAALFNIATFPLAAIRKCRLEIGESAIVMGQGMLGVLALQLLKAAGAAPIIAVDPNPAKREKALKSGADFALDPYAPDFTEMAKQITGGGAKVGIEVTGIGAGLDGILDCMARFGRVALLGCTRNSDFTIDYYRKVHGPGITLVGAHTIARPDTDSSTGWWTEKDDMEAVIRLTKLGRLDLASLVDETYSPEQAQEVYHRLAFDKTFPLTQFDWSNIK